MPASTKEIAIAVVIRNGCVLMLKRVSSDECLQWGFPGGKVESGESPAETALRETLEETGIQCRALRSLGSRLHPDSKRMIHYVLCDWVSGTVTNVEPDKAYSVEWVKNESVSFLITSDLFPAVTLELAKR